MATIADVVPLVLALGITIANLHDKKDEVSINMLFNALIQISHTLNLSFFKIIQQKMRLNYKKYSNQEEKDNNAAREISKYKVDYKEMFNTKTIHKYKCICLLKNKHNFWDHFQGWQEMVHKFAEEKGWLSKYTHNKVLISLFTELGELTQLFEWKHQTMDISRHLTLKNDIALELADIGIYALHMSRLINYKKLKPSLYMFPIKTDSDLMPAFSSEYQTDKRHVKNIVKTQFK